MLLRVTKAHSRWVVVAVEAHRPCANDCEARGHLLLDHRGELDVITHRTSVDDWSQCGYAARLCRSLGIVNVQHLPVAVCVPCVDRQHLRRLGDRCHRVDIVSSDPVFNPSAELIELHTVNDVFGSAWRADSMGFNHLQLTALQRQNHNVAIKHHSPQVHALKVMEAELTRDVALVGIV